MDDDNDSNDTGSEAMDISDDESMQESDVEMSAHEDTQLAQEPEFKQESGGDLHGTLNNHNHSSIPQPYPRNGLNDSGPPRTSAVAALKDISTRLPGAVWQKIFKNLSPVQLARCTRVCRTFNTLLDRTYDADPPRGRRLAARLVTSESIWAYARRATYEKIHLPKPLPGFSESQMLRFAASDVCQECDKRSDTSKHASLIDHVQPIWQFEFAVCGGCIEHTTLKADELYETGLLSKEALESGLTYIFLVTNGNILFENDDDRYPGLPVEKVFSRAEKKMLIAEYEEIMKLGEGAAEGWLEGLEGRRDEALKQAARWSRWEASLPAGTNIRAYLHAADPAAKLSTNGIRSNSSTTLNGTPASHPGTHAALPTLQSSQTGSNYSRALGVPDTAFHRTLNRPKVPNLPPEVQDKRRKRGEEICRRCARLTPPIPYEILQHLTSYNASLQVSRLLTEEEWNMLKPRLENEKEQWEQQDYERRQQEALMNVQTLNPRDLMRPNKVERDSAWEHAQDTIRNALVAYTKQRIASVWPDPETRTGRNAPVFAVDVLKNVVEQWTKATVGRTGDPNSVLTLGTMKSVYASHIFPHASKDAPPEIFVCSECGEGTRKWLSFEGLIQHHGAVHTDDFKAGNSPVDWRAAWPQQLPFLEDVTRILLDEERNNRRQEQRHHPAPQRNISRRQAEVTPTDDEVATTQQNAEQEHLQKTVQEGLSVWNTLSTMTGLEMSIRVQATLTSMYQYYGREAENVLTTGKLVELVTGYIELEQLCNATGLMCAICDPQPARNGQHSSTTYYERMCSKKLYNIHALLNHFHMAHRGNLLDNWPWPGCIDLQDATEILSYRDSPQMNEGISQLLVKHLPLELVRGWVDSRAIPSGDGGVVARMVQKRLASEQSSKRKKSRTKNHGRKTRPSAQDSQDEYDPEDQTTAPYDPSRFDSGWTQLPERRAPEEMTPSPRLTKRHGEIAETQPVPLVMRAPHTRAPSYQPQQAPSYQASHHPQTPQQQSRGQIDHHPYVQVGHVGQDLFSSLLLPPQRRSELVPQGGHADRYSLPAQQTPHLWRDEFGRLFQRDEHGRVVELELID